jgi:hypothetical protein
VWRAPYLKQRKDRNKVMDITNAVDAENRDIIMYKNNGGKHQQWDLIYAKDWKGEPTTGEWNREYGLKVNIDFHIISTLG